MKLGILSDSHKKVDLTLQAIEYLKSENVEYLIHAGDLEIEENLKLLKDSNLTYVSVFGNNDYNLVSLSDKYTIKKEPYYFKIKDLKFKLMHLPFYMTPDADIVISGHTHIFEHSHVNDTLFLNPGEICAREKDKTECVVLEITDNKYIIEYNYREIENKNWKTETIEYDRK